MAESRRFLLGHGESLTRRVDLSRGGGEKTHLYTFHEAQRRAAHALALVNKRLEKMPEGALPRDEAVIMLTLHPSYLAKSHFPDELLKAAKLRSVGTRGVTIRPDKTTKRQAGRDLRSVEIYAAGTRNALERWAKVLPNWSDIDTAALQLRSLEKVYSEAPDDRVRTRKGAVAVTMYEGVLHVPAHADYIISAFQTFVSTCDGKVLKDKIHRLGGLAYVPLYASGDALEEIAEFSYLRGIRSMPAMRDFEMFRSTEKKAFRVDLPADAAVNPHLTVAVFDGGLPALPDLQTWATSFDCDGVAGPTENGTRHGLGVTSAALFGHMKDGDKPARPYAKINHYRVAGEDEEPPHYYAMLDRIANVLKNQVYDFVNISVGPRVSLDDSLLHLWTTTLDDLLSHGQTLAFIAVGNDGEKKKHRISAPSDAVNGIGVGAADTHGEDWRKSPYSSIGPGRTTGVVKPDILSFGGCPSEHYGLLGPDKTGAVVGWWGTSFSCPDALRIGLAVGANFGHHLTAMAIKALLVHHAAKTKRHDVHDVGWGRIPSDPMDLVTCKPDAAHIVYQGQLTPRKSIRIPVPVPDRFGNGPVYITVTICYASRIEPEHSESYTSAGLDVYFRPDSRARSNPAQIHADTATFFRAADLQQDEGELRNDSMKWETVRKRQRRFDANRLHEPAFDIHYVAREGGSEAVDPPPIPYSMVITVRQKGMNQLYDRIAAKYSALQQMRPSVQIPIRLRT